MGIGLALMGWGEDTIDGCDRKCMVCMLRGRINVAVSGENTHNGSAFTEGGGRKGSKGHLGGGRKGRKGT